MKRRIFFLALLAVIMLIPLGFTIWAESAAEPMPEALQALQGDAQVSVTPGDWLVFTPVDRAAQSGLILYPGGRVDARAYAPLALEIARQGYLVVIVKMPLNLAVFAPERAASVMQAYPQIEHWAVGGHSLGGAMAAEFAFRNPQAVDGLVLWAAYPAGGSSLAESGIAVVSISASLDGLATPGKIESARHLLPANTRTVVIEGGNHAQFGWYGPQSGDLPAQISRTEQQRQVVAATLELLNQITSESAP